MAYIDQPVSQETPLQELRQMLTAPDMQTFMETCKALAGDGSREAYDLLKTQLVPGDSYRYRYVLETIYQFPWAAELDRELEKALLSEKGFLVRTAMKIVIERRHSVPEALIFTVLREKGLDAWYYGAIALLRKTTENREQVLALYHANRDNSSVRVAIAELLPDFYGTELDMDLFRLLADDPVAHIRIVACRLAAGAGRKDLLAQFTEDRDGHIRKYVQRALCAP